MPTTRDLLSSHETVAQFGEVYNQPCRHMTSLCPDRCGHGGTTAVFNVRKYLKYEKPGHYGDKESDKYHVRPSDDVDCTGLTDDRKVVFDSLKEGDYVLLSWNHDYVHREGSSFPQRPITKLEKITEEEAKKLL